MKITSKKRLTSIVCSFFVLSSIASQGAFVAFNDHAPGVIGTQTSNNTTRIDCSVAGSGNLKNITNGATLPVIMSVSILGTGLSTGATAGVPDSDTPLANTFDGNVYFGQAPNPPPYSCIQLKAGTTLTFTFRNLDPTKRYSFKGGAVRGNPSDSNGSTYFYTNRWTLVDIQGVVTAVPNHQQGAGSRWGYMDASRVTDGSLTGYQAAFQFGVNTNGDMAEWNNIDPGSDGSFSIVCSQYVNGTTPFPSGYGTDSSVCWANSGVYGYGITGIRLEEYDMVGPSVTITSPTNNAVYVAPGFIPLEVSARTTAGTITNVAYFQGTTKVGESTTSPFTAYWSGVPVGNYTLKAVASDSMGLSATSIVVNVAVSANHPPTVSLTNLTNNASYTAPVHLTLEANAADSDGSITKVEFYQGLTKVGESTSAPYSINWSTSVAGSYSFTAAATDNSGTVTTSDPIQITVVEPKVYGGLAFNGVNQYVTFGRASGLGASNFTLEVWFKWSGGGQSTSTGSGGVTAIPLIAKCYGESDGDSRDGNYFLGIADGGVLGVDFEEGSTGASPGLNHPARGITSITTGVWHHAAVTFDGSYWAIYLDGNLETTSYVGELPRWDSIQYAALGSAMNSSGSSYGYFSGVLDEARIWNYARTAAEIANSCTLQITSAPGLLGRWGLNETNGAIARDSAGSAINGTLVNNPVWTNGYPFVLPPSLALTAPTNGAVFSAGENLTLSAEDSDTTATISKIEFYAGTDKLGEATASPYTCVWTNAPGGFYSLKAVATDTELNLSTSAPVAIAVYGTPHYAAQTLVATGAVWKYLDTGANLGMAWTSASFDDSSWASGAAELGYGDGGETTILSYGSDPDQKYVTTYFRRNFVADYPSTITNLTVHLLRDDGAVVYLNGHEIVRDGLTAGALYSDYSTNTVGSPDETTYFAFNHINPAYLVAGTNVLAVEIHQCNASSTDLSFDMDLVADAMVGGNPPPAVSLTGPADGTTFYQPADVTLSATASDFDGVSRVDFYLNNMNIGQAITANPYTLPCVIATEGEYVATARATDARGNAGWSAPVSFRVRQPLNSVVLVPTNAWYTLYKGYSEASSPRSAWRDYSFNDSTWSSNQAPFYFDLTPGGDADTYYGNTELTDMYNGYLSIYLRHKFVVNNPQVLTNLILRAKYDDGFVAWLNGIEVFRTPTVQSSPGVEIPYNYSSSVVSALSETPDGPFSTNLIAVPSSVLVAGTNILTIHACNTTISSSDFLMDFEVKASMLDASESAPMISSVTPAAGNVGSLNSITVVFSKPVQNVDASDLLVNGVAATGLSGGSNSWTFTFTQPSYGAVSITWAENHGITDFDSPPKAFAGTAFGATWQYALLNPNAPTLLSEQPAGNATVYALTDIVVQFSEAVTHVDASDLLINGVAANSVSGSGASYTFSFAQPNYGPVSVSWAANHGITDLETPANAFDASQSGATWQYTLVDHTSPTILSKVPAEGNAPSLTEIQVTFSESVANVNAKDLLINGIAATNVNGSGASYTFSFPQPNASVVHITWAANHGITDLASTHNAFDASAPGSTWDYNIPDDRAPSIVSIYPPPFLAVRSLGSISITFDEPVTGVSPGAVSVDGDSAAGVTGSGAGPYVFTFSQPGLGAVEVTFSGDQIRDLSPTPNYTASIAWTYNLNPSIPLPYAVDHVVHISLDGAGAVYIEQYLNSISMPTYEKLRRQGSSTLNARCDYDYSITLPNHTSILTGRPVLQPDGWADTTYHGLTTDSDNGSTVHDPSQSNPNVSYKYSLFDVVHDNGLSTAFLYSKQSLTIFARSWNETYGAADTNGVDNGRNKIDFVFNSSNGSSYGPTAPVVDQFVQRVETNGLWSYTFMHFDDGDATGHSYGWGSVNYQQAITNTDGQIGRVLNAIQSNPVYSNSTILIVTADHGGGDPTTSHTTASSSVNYRVPIFVIGPGIPAGGNLYDLFANRADPGANRYSYSESSVLQPLRNGDTANLGLGFLGLPPIPGSSMLPVFAQHVGLSVVQSGGVVTVSWPISAGSFQLKASTTLGSTANWQTITSGISTQGEFKVYSFTPAPNTPVVFFRLDK